jgi:hypothetical protein
MRYALLALVCAGFSPFAAAALDPLMVIPHVVDGGAWKTTLQFANLGTHNVSLNVQFVQDDGTDFIVPMAGNADVAGGPQFIATLHIAPGQVVTMQTAGTASATKGGWGVAYQTQTDCCPEPMGAMAIYTQHVPGGQDQEASVPITDSVSGNFALLFDNTAYTTGIAIASHNDAAIPLVAHIRDPHGKEIDQQTILIPKNGHVAFSLPDLWRSTAGIAGSIQFSTSGAALSAFGLRFNGGAFTTFNPFPIGQ